MPTTEAEPPVAEKPESSVADPAPQTFVDSGGAGATAASVLSQVPNYRKLSFPRCLGIITDLYRGTTWNG